MRKWAGRWALSSQRCCESGNCIARSPSAVPCSFVHDAGRQLLLCLLRQGQPSRQPLLAFPSVDSHTTDTLCNIQRFQRSKRVFAQQTKQNTTGLLDITAAGSCVSDDATKPCMQVGGVDKRQRQPTPLLALCGGESAGCPRYAGAVAAGGMAACCMPHAPIICLRRRQATTPPVCRCCRRRHCFTLAHQRPGAHTHRRGPQALQRCCTAGSFRSRQWGWEGGGHAQNSCLGHVMAGVADQLGRFDRVCCLGSAAQAVLPPAIHQLT
jgi:hypothetical protein